MIVILINGEERSVSSATINDLLKELSLHGRKVAVELNRKIVQRDRYEQTALTAGDSIEIVNFVGGG